jgi:hypothetical protein
MQKSDSGTRRSIAAAAVLVLLAAAALWRSWQPNDTKDYEDCAEEAQSRASSKAEYSKLISHCSERFAGRRKAGGGYTYFDFMQNRSFDIAGPNPTEDERRQIDRTYMEFLGSRRREMLSSVLTKALADQEQSSFAHHDIGSPLVLAPKIPLPSKRPTAERPKSCEDGSLSCIWARLSAAVRSAVAPSPGANRSAP